MLLDTMDAAVFVGVSVHPSVFLCCARVTHVPLPGCTTTGPFADGAGGSLKPSDKLSLIK